MSTNTIVIFNIFIFLLGCGEVNVAQHDDAKVKTDEKAEIISDSKDAALDSDTAIKSCRNPPVTRIPCEF
jgi:hypothetical protein